MIKKPQIAPICCSTIYIPPSKANNYSKLAVTRDLLLEVKFLLIFSAILNISAWLIRLFFQCLH